MNQTKLIPLELDVHGYLLERAAESNQTASNYLRVQLSIPVVPPREEKQASAASTELEALIDSDRFRYAKGVVGRFMVFLSWLHERHQAQFSVVANIRGRGRLYFAEKSPNPLHESGRSVNPKQIPGTDWWVITTSPTPLKQEMLGRVMSAFGYTRAEITRAQLAIDGGSLSVRQQRQRILASL